MSKRRVAAGVLFGLLAGSLMTIGADHWLSTVPDHDSVDRFKVIGSVKDPNAETSAVLVDYEHGNSSSGGSAIWIVKGNGPAAGSIEPLSGEPALVSIVPISVDEISWQPKGRPVLKISAPISVVVGLQHCYYDDLTVPTICMNPGVDVEVAR
jgi:hypothetical protein